MLIDSHCHLDYLERRGEKLIEILNQARSVGVQRFLTVATTLSGEDTLAEYCAQFPGVYRSVGVHPNHAHETPELTSEQLIKMTQKPKVIALGETGLDYFRGDTDAEIQKKLFRAHIFAAQETDIPLIIHTRSADEDTLSIMQKAYAEKPYRGVFHCYIGSEKILKAALEMNFYISITGIVTYGKSKELRAALESIPRQSIMVETDAPFLAPKPHRGKQCEPAMVRYTAQCIADELDWDLEDFTCQTTQNFFRLFNRAEI